VSARRGWNPIKGQPAHCTGKKQPGLEPQWPEPLSKKSEGDLLWTDPTQPSNWTEPEAVGPRCPQDLGAGSRDVVMATMPIRCRLDVNLALAWRQDAAVTLCAQGSERSARAPGLPQANAEVALA
jgi:hypothetical protein